MAKDIHDLSLLDIAPASISTDAQVAAISQALDIELRSVSHDIREALLISRIDELPDPVLNLLAWQWHVDFYEPSELSLLKKRALVKGSIAWHQKKGTPWAVKKILQDLGVEAKILEWYDIGTAPYTFAVEATYKGDPSHVLDFLGEGTNELLRKAIEVTKPVRSHLLYLIVLPTYPGDDGTEYGCLYGYCAYGHGYLNDEQIHIGLVGDASGSTGVVDLCDYAYMSMSAAYSRSQMYGASRYGETLLFAKLALSERDYCDLYADREYLPKNSRPWRSNRPKNGSWRFGRTWTNDMFLLGVSADAWETAKSCAVYGHSSYGGLAYMGPRYWKVESAGRYGYTSYGESGIDEPHWEAIYEFRVESDDMTLDASNILPSCFLGTVEREDLLFTLSQLSPVFEEIWTDADLNKWRDDKSWIESGNWVRHFETTGDAWFVNLSGISRSVLTEWKETLGGGASYVGDKPCIDDRWTDCIMNTWQPEKDWLSAGTWFKDV